MRIIVKNISVKAHHSIELVKCYHGSFCQIYSIIIIKLPKINFKLALQMFFKTFNNLARSNGLISILLVFGSYLYMINMNAPSPTINQYSITIYNAMEEVKKSYASCQVNNALNT